MSYESDRILKAADYQNRYLGYADAQVLCTMNQVSREFVNSLLSRNGFVATGVEAHFKKKEIK